jgi:hypothetical protein
MKKSKFTLPVLALAGAVLVLAGCRKNREIDNDTSAAADNQLADNLFTEVHKMADAVVAGTFQQTMYKSSDTVFTTGCATVTHDTTTNPRTITINFGSTNCMCADGKNRRGIINVSYTGPYRDSNTVITHTFSNYFVNDNQVTGTKTVTNMGHNANNQLYYNIYENGAIYKATGGTISWTSNRVRTWISGESTVFNWLDDVYLISGSGNGTSSNGTQFTVSITSPLRVELSCPRIVSGTVDITPAGKSTRTLDYGAGNCDYTATVTVNGNTYTITLF